jgi:imidazolonepropionase-like amidohydrolase
VDASAHPYRLIRARRLIDGIADAPLDRGAVLFENGRIIAVGRQEDVVPPEGPGVEILDYGDMTVLPGLVDCHTHLNGFGDGRPGEETAALADEVLTLQSARSARAALETGVTTIRENGAKNMTTFRLREAMRLGIVDGPRMLLCGRMMTIVGGHLWYFGREVTGPVEARGMVRQLVKEGADFIKIAATGGTTRTSRPLLPAFDLDELQAITGEARKFGLLTAAHCASTQGTINCLDAGVDMIIHAVFREPDGTDAYRPDVAERMVEQEVFVNPTLHVFRAQIWGLLYKREREGLSEAEEALVREKKRAFEARLEDSARLIDLGAKMITGSDSSWADYRLGNSVLETECLVMAGLSPMQGVKSHTSWAAQAIGVDDIVGTLEVGKDADIIVVAGNPAEDLRALWAVKDVFKAGRRIDRGSGRFAESVRQPIPADAEWNAYPADLRRARR